MRYSWLSCLLLIVLAVGCKQQPEPHVIGHVAPRSGPDQAAGMRLGEAVAMVVSDVNVSEAKWIEGKAVAVVHGDTGADVDGYAFQGTRLAAVNRVEALLGGTNAAEFEKLIPVIQTNSIILVSPSGGTVDNASKLAFCVGIEPKERGRILGKYAAEERKLTDVAVLTDATNPIFPAMAGAFVREFGTPDRKIRSETNLPRRNSFPDLAARLAKAKPQAILFAGTARDLLSLRGELQKAGISADTPILFAGEEEEAALKRDPESLSGIIWTTAFFADDPTKAAQEFATNFRTRTQHLPDAADALSYDAARILFNAARLAKSFRYDKLRDELKKFSETDGLTGPFWFTPEQTARRTVHVVRFSDGGVKLAKSYAPSR